MYKRRSGFFQRIQSLLKRVRARANRWGILLLIVIFLGAVGLPIVAEKAVATSIVQRVSNAQTLMQQGRTLYEAERFSEAAVVLQQAASAFQAAGDKLWQAATLSNLSLVYQQLGQWPEAENAIAQSLTLLETKPYPNPASERAQILAQTLDVRGRLQLSRGQAEPALKSWQRAAETYVKIGDSAGMIRSRLNQAQALQAMGFYLQARKTLIEANQLLEKQPDSPLKAAGLHNQGNILRVIGELEKAQEALQQSLAVARTLQLPQAISEALLGLGQTAQAKGDTQTALNYYQQAIASAPSPAVKIQIQLNQLSLLLQDQKWDEASNLWPSIFSQIDSLPPSRNTIYARINLAQSLMKLSAANGSGVVSGDIGKLLAKAIQSAKSLKDPRAESYALGTLGQLYEKTQQESEALDLTQNALAIAQTIDASEISYQWQWQIGRLLKTKGDTKGSILAYDQAVETLQSLRSDLAATNPEVQFSFREDVEPVYRQFVDLLLRSSDTNLQLKQDYLLKARQAIESLQLAELDNFFRQACLIAKRSIDAVVDEDQTAAFIYPVILPDSIDVILKLPQQPLRHYATPIAQEKVETLLEQLRKDLTDIDTLKEVQAQSQQVYNWLIAPAATDIAQSQVKTLVFVLDGSLRNIPMAALYDGQQYLIEKYAIALAPGLQLVDPKPVDRVRLQALIGGLSEARHGFRSLPYVENEIKRIQTEVSGRTLFNQQFTSQAFNNQVSLQPLPIVHLATHGKFSSSAEETFILAWDKPIKVKELNTLLRTRDQRRPEPIELLVLSACETATGDKRAALGLAGVAIRAGARSTLASLWPVDDESTTLLMSQFYQGITNRQLTKAEALRQAQLALLQNPNSNYHRPLHWAPFVLLGNWL